MKRICLASALLAFLGCFYCFDVSAQVTSDADGTINELTIGDDSSSIVDLQFDFPLFGQTFTRSHMHTNGVVSFTGANVSTPAFHWCCNGIDLQGATITVDTYDYAIAVFWTDLIQSGGKAKLYTQGTDQFQRYMWKGLNEFTTSNANNVGLEIRPDGSFDMHHDYMELTKHSYTIAIMGDVSTGEYHQYGHGVGTANNPYVFGSAFEDTRITGWAVNNSTYSHQNGTTASSTGGGGGNGGNGGNSTQNNVTELVQVQVDPCDSDPLYSSSCSGYATAYYNQQCSQNALHDSGCPGYAEAYYDQQCSQDALHDSGCPGYAEAYYNQQCGLNALYDTGCPGYAEAYYANQCSLDALYDTGCPGYTEAVIAQNCAVDPLFSPTCDGYQDALAATLLEEQEEVVVAAENDETVQPAVEVVEVIENVVPNAEQEATQVASVAEDVTAVVEVEGVPNVTALIPELPVVDVQATAVLARRTEFQAELRQEAQAEIVQQQEFVVAAIEEEVVAELEAEVDEPVEEQQVSAEAPAVDEKPAETETKPEPEADEPEEKVEEKETAEEKQAEPKKKPAKKTVSKREQKLKKVRKIIAKRSQTLAERMGETVALEQQKQLQLNIIAVMGYVPGFRDYTGIQLQDNQFYTQPQMPGGEVIDNRRVSRYLLNDSKFNELELLQYQGRVEGTR